MITGFVLFWLFILLFIPFIIALVIYFIGLWKLFQKCGYNGWEAIIPFYNSWILLKISGLNSWYYLLIMANIICSLSGLEGLALIGNLASLVASFFMYYNISKKFHKDMFFTVLMFLFSGVMIPILGFGKNNVYDSNVVVSPNGPIGDNEFNSNGANNNYSSNMNGNNANYSSNVSETNDNYTSNVNEKYNRKNSYCRQCGSKLDAGANFCRNCGSKINEE